VPVPVIVRLVMVVASQADPVPELVHVPEPIATVRVAVPDTRNVPPEPRVTLYVTAFNVPEVKVIAPVFVLLDW
jgi:hypothetical protein